MAYTSESFSFDAIGTHWEIQVTFEKSKAMYLLDKIKKRIEVFDKHYSRFRSDSLITKISKKEGTYKMPDDFEELFNTYKKLFDVTHGLFTPLIGNVLESLGYDKTYSLEHKNATSPDSFHNVLSLKENILTVKKPVVLDFGAGGKGYLVDIIGKLLKKESITEFLINAGGDILHNSQKKIHARIGLENPINTSQVIGVADILNTSICGSAGNRRTWGDYHHIINPKTLTSPKNILGVWVVAPSALIADSMTTVLYLDQSEAAKNAYPCEYFILYSDMTFDKSENFNAELFLM